MDTKSHSGASTAVALSLVAVLLIVASAVMSVWAAFLPTLLLELGLLVLGSIVIVALLEAMARRRKAAEWTHVAARVLARIGGRLGHATQMITPVLNRDLFGGTAAAALSPSLRGSSTYLHELADDVRAAHSTTFNSLFPNSMGTPAIAVSASLAKNLSDAADLRVVPLLPQHSAQLLDLITAMTDALDYYDETTTWEKFSGPSLSPVTIERLGDVLDRMADLAAYVETEMARAEAGSSFNSWVCATCRLGGPPS